MDHASDILTGAHARIEDAGVLADRERDEGALLMLLLAVAATARKRYPRGTPSRVNAGKKMGDHEAFTTFLSDDSEKWLLVREHDDFVRYGGKDIRIEEFLYTFLRCHLVHEGRTPADLYPMRDTDLLTIDHPDGTGRSFTRLLLARLSEVVRRAPENSPAATKLETEAIKKRRDSHPLRRPHL